MKYLSAEIVITLNRKIIETYSPEEAFGLEEPYVLKNELNRLNQILQDGFFYQDIYEKAAAVFETIAKIRVFESANKRTAFASMIYFLFMNGYLYVINKQGAKDLMINFANGKITFDEAVKIIKGMNEKEEEEFYYYY